MNTAPGYMDIGLKPLTIQVVIVSGVARTHGQCDTGTVQQATWSTDQLLQGQSAEDLGCPAAGLHTEAGWHVSQGT